jgi:putative salt-induced outer membrane protein YdiY
MATSRATHSQFASSVLFALLAYGPEALAQQQPGAPPPPPPRLEATAQFSFLDTNGNADTQSLGAGGNLTWRPDPWTYSTKLIFAQTESDDYRLAISTTSEFTYEPRFLQPLADASTSRFEHTAALTVALNTILSLKLPHILRYSAEPPAGFDTTDSITAVSLVAKVLRQQ